MMRGQIAIEFSFMVMLSFIFLIIILVIATFYLELSSTQRAERAVEETAIAIQQELLLAASVEDGYQRVFSVPETLEGRSFTITNTPLTLTLQLNDGWTLNKDIPLVTGTLIKGDNIIRKEGVIIILN
ncbi:hypothetical protein GOV07_01510 [Candidatus Woesearchaeota archaeon]|nr:hypothetical protein [Candidatus Woesearchaeota archaeon]